MAGCPRADNPSAKEMKAFLERREGVKGLVDSGITNIPSFFIRSPETFSPNSCSDATLAVPLQIPIIDLKGVESERRREIVEAIRDAAQTWGFFRMVNHGVPIPTMENMIDAIRQFHEQPHEVKKAWYSRNQYGQRLVDYHTNTKGAAWRDTLALEFPDGDINEQAIPQVCRKLTLPDGTILRVKLPGRPISNPTRDGKSLVKIWNLNEFTGVMCVFSCQGAEWCKVGKTNVIHNEPPDTIARYVGIRDLDSLPKVAGAWR
ncbi:hypothetical protein V6N12_042817 [Hibiscus sabdariffa]|uniref:Non-haem dioxygenase N-terminal domain-containing protein n=1 Tax=Hibiscus sabdariffa TaxID=183260 RepID=A0ABR2AUM8_9ROSI